MGVHTDAGFVISKGYHKVGGLPPYSLEPKQLFNLIRYMGIVPQENFSGRHDGAGRQGRSERSPVVGRLRLVDKLPEGSRLWETTTEYLPQPVTAGVQATPQCGGT